MRAGAGAARARAGASVRHPTAASASERRRAHLRRRPRPPHHAGRSGRARAGAGDRDLLPRRRAGRAPRCARRRDRRRRARDRRCTATGTCRRSCARPRELGADLDRAETVIAEATGHSPVFYRPPFGVFSSAALLAARRRGWTPLLWSRWGREWEPGATPEKVVRRAGRSLTAGDVVLLHDASYYGLAGFADIAAGALPAILETLSELGLPAVAVSRPEERRPGPVSRSSALRAAARRRSPVSPLRASVASRSSRDAFASCRLSPSSRTITSPRTKRAPTGWLTRVDAGAADRERALPAGEQVLAEGEPRRRQVVAIAVHSERRARDPRAGRGVQTSPSALPDPSAGSGSSWARAIELRSPQSTGAEKANEACALCRRSSASSAGTSDGGALDDKPDVRLRGRDDVQRRDIERRSRPARREGRWREAQTGKNRAMAVRRPRAAPAGLATRLGGRTRRRRQGEAARRTAPASHGSASRRAGARARSEARPSAPPANAPAAPGPA